MKRSIVILATLAALALSVQPSALAASDCRLAQGSGQTQLNVANGRFEGVLSFVVGGMPMSVFSSAEIVAEEFRGAVWFVTTSHRLTLPDGSVLTTLDNARLIPTPQPGVFRAVSKVAIASGGSGFLVAVGTLDFTGLPTATWRLITGQLCGVAT